MKPLSNIAQQLSSRAADDGRFRVSIGELSDLTGIEETEIYSTAYRLGGKVNFSDAVDGFSEETVGELVTLLEELSETAATQSSQTTGVESEFTDCGIFLPHDRRLELMANFLALVQHQARGHEIDTDTFFAMMLHFKSFEESFATYVQEFFDLEGAKKRAAEHYRESFDLPEAALHTARRYLDLLFERKILQPRGLFVSLRSRLAELAWAAGLSGSRRERYYTYGEEGDGDRSADDAVASALQTMQLRRDELSAGRLKQQYKRLMKRYHPDINPDGLEMSKKITSSYSILLQAV